MQPQITAIKQLSEINNITASQIEEILVKALGQRASWEQSSTFNELAELEDPKLLSPIQAPEDIRWILELLWRSRTDLNDARINAEEVDLESFLTALGESNLRVSLDFEKQIAERDREIERLKVDLADFIEARKTAKFREQQIQELQTSVKNHHEQFDNLKSHTEVTLKAIAMSLNALRGERKPDETKKVDGVMVTFRNYDDNLTHHHKTIIIENLQRAIADEARKLKAQSLKDFSFDDMPF